MCWFHFLSIDRFGPGLISYQIQTAGKVQVVCDLACAGIVYYIFHSIFNGGFVRILCAVRSLAAAAVFRVVEEKSSCGKTLALCSSAFSDHEYLCAAWRYKRDSNHL